MKGVLIFGANEIAEVVAEQLTDHGHNVKGFVVDRRYLTASEFCGLPLVAFENVEERFTVAANEFVVGCSYRGLNKLREEKFQGMIAKGFQPFTFVHRLASVARSALIGPGAFIQPFNSIQTKALVGGNVMMWAGSHVGHHSRVDGNSFITTHVCISGHCHVGPRCFFGVGSTIIDGVKLGARCIIGAGETVRRDLPDEAVFAHGEVSKTPSSAMRGVWANG